MNQYMTALRIQGSDVEKKKKKQNQFILTGRGLFETMVFLILYLRLACTSLCSPGWLQTYNSPLASAFPVAGDIGLSYHVW